MREMKTRMAGGSTFTSGRSRPQKGGKQGLPDLNENGYFAKGYGPPLKMTTLGSLSLQFGEPISLANYARLHMSERAARRLDAIVPRPLTTSISASLDLDIAAMTSDLAYHIIDRLHSRSVVHGTHIVAATLLMYRSAGSISFKDLETHVRFLADELEARGMIVDLAPRHPSQWSTAVRRALGLLQDSVREVRTGVFAPNGETRMFGGDQGAGGGGLGGGGGDGVDPRIHFIELAYLRNKIMHVFSREAVWACALHACSKKQVAMGHAGVGGVPLHELLENAIFMDKLFAREVSFAGYWVTAVCV
jgi:glycerol-3-phosphate O-acyltransferase